MPNKALHWTGIPLRSIPASELGRWQEITMNQTTNIDRFWTALLEAANNIVTKPDFLQVVTTCPYFEGWWMVELARRFAKPTDTTQYYKLAGFIPWLYLIKKSIGNLTCYLTAVKTVESPKLGGLNSKT